jgi:hypothetical protein
MNTKRPGQALLVATFGRYRVQAPTCALLLVQGARQLFVGRSFDAANHIGVTAGDNNSANEDSNKNDEHDPWQRHPSS